MQFDDDLEKKSGCSNLPMLIIKAIKKLFGWDTDFDEFYDT